MAPEQPAADEPAVADRIRVPEGVERAGRRIGAWFTAQPVLARIFIALAAFDVVARTLGIVGPAVSLDVRTPLVILASFVPHSLLILLPALIVMRRHDAVATLPGLVDGAIFVALVTLLSDPTTALASRIGGIALWAPASIAGIVLGIVGWVGIGRGLGGLNPTLPSPTIAGWANLAAAAILASVAWSLVTFLTGPGIDIGVAQLNGLLALNTLALILAPVALAYVYRSVIRGFEDDRRPELGLRLGTAAALLAAGLAFAGVVVELLAFAGTPVARSITETVAWGWLRWLGTGGATGLLVVAFALGLADPSERPAADASH